MSYSKGTVTDFMGTPSGSYAKMNGIWSKNHDYKKGDVVERWHNEAGDEVKVVVNGLLRYERNKELERVKTEIWMSKTLLEKEIKHSKYNP